MKCPRCGKKIKAAAIMAHQRADSQTPARRKTIASVAAHIRWAKYYKTLAEMGNDKHRKHMYNP